MTHAARRPLGQLVPAPNMAGRAALCDHCVPVPQPAALAGASRRLQRVRAGAPPPSRPHV
eukprot:198758-Prymnesium_polylepis.1